MTTKPKISIIDYDEVYALETVKMWRTSMEDALQMKDLHSWEDQLNYLASIVQEHQVFLAFDDEAKAVVGMMAVGGKTGTELDQLYIHVDYQGIGVGSRLLSLAKKVSSDRLQLYTFEINQVAQRFYEKHGFTVIGRGIEPESGRADIRYEWVSKNSDGDK